MAHKADLLLDFGASSVEISPMILGSFAERIGGVYYDGLWVGNHASKGRGCISYAWIKKTKTEGRRESSFCFAIDRKYTAFNGRTAAF